MQSVLEQGESTKYDVSFVYRMGTVFQVEGRYACHEEAPVRPEREPGEADLDAFAELEQIEQGHGFGVGGPLHDAYMPEGSPVILLTPANRDQASELLAMLPEEIKLLGETLERLQEAVRTRRSLRGKRIGRLTMEATDLRKVLTPFAEMPSGYTSTQLEMRRTHLEKTLDTSKDRIDMEDRACDREILALEGQVDETLRQYLTSKQLLGMMGP